MRSMRQRRPSAEVFWQRLSSWSFPGMVNLAVESKRNQAEARRQGNMEARRGPPPTFFVRM